MLLRCLLLHVAPFFCSCSIPYFSCSSYFSAFLREICVLGFLKVTFLVVGLPTDVTGCLVFPSGELISLIFPSLDPASSLLRGDSLIVIGTSEGDCGFPYVILVLFLVFKYMGPCIRFLLLGLTCVLNVANVASTYCLIFPGERLLSCACFFISWGLEGLVFFPTCFSPSSSLVFASSSSIYVTSSSSIFPDLSFFVFPPLPPVPEACFSVCDGLGFNENLPIHFYATNSSKSVHRIGFLKWLKESIAIKLMRSWWVMC